MVKIVIQNFVFQWSVINILLIQNAIYPKIEQTNKNWLLYIMQNVQYHLKKLPHIKITILKTTDMH